MSTPIGCLGRSHFLYNLGGGVLVWVPSEPQEKTKRNKNGKYIGKSHHGVGNMYISKTLPHEGKRRVSRIPDERRLGKAADDDRKSIEPCGRPYRHRSIARENAHGRRRPMGEFRYRLHRTQFFRAPGHATTMAHLMRTPPPVCTWSQKGRGYMMEDPGAHGGQDTRPKEAPTWGRWSAM